MEQKNHFHLNIGISSFIVVFVTLCLVTFAVLSLVSAKANKRLNDKVISQVESYYEMSNQAYQKIRDIDESLHQISKQTSSQEEYFHQVKQIITLDEDNQYTFSITGKTQILQVKLQLYAPMPQKAYYEIIEWSKKNNSDWNPDQDINIYGG